MRHIPTAPCDIGLQRQDDAWVHSGRTLRKQTPITVHGVRSTWGFCLWINYISQTHMVSYESYVLKMEYGCFAKPIDTNNNEMSQVMMNHYDHYDEQNSCRYFIISIVLMLLMTHANHPFPRLRTTHLIMMSLTFKHMTS